MNFQQIGHGERYKFSWLWDHSRGRHGGSSSNQEKYKVVNEVLICEWSKVEAKGNTSTQKCVI